MLSAKKVNKMKIGQLNNTRIHIFIYLIVIIPIHFLFGAFETYPTSTANLAFGNLNLNGKGNIIDIINEPSSIITFNLNGGEVIWNRPYQINELQQTAFAASMIYKNWGFGISAGIFGNNIYSESMLALSIAKSIKSRLSLGINIALYQLKIADYRTEHAPGLSASLRYNVNKNWDWVSTVRNINSPNIGTLKDDLSQIVATGFVGKVHEVITVVTEWEKDLEYNGAIKFGIMVRPLEPLLLLAGFVSNPGQLTAGLSIKINKIYIEYGTIAYYDLGLFTHQLGIGVNLCRRQTDYRSTERNFLVSTKS